MEVPADSYMRVHTRVKRFPAAVETDWSSRIIHVADEFVVVDKVCSPTLPRPFGTLVLSSCCPQLPALDGVESRF
eukprot:1192386-Prorocentrum_minimum.AAC.2